MSSRAEAKEGVGLYRDDGLAVCSASPKQIEKTKQEICKVFKANNLNITIGGRVGVVVRALAFHQCGPGSISALGVKCGLSLLVLYSAMRGFPPGTPVFPSHQKQTFDLI